MKENSQYLAVKKNSSAHNKSAASHTLSAYTQQRDKDQMPEHTCAMQFKDDYLFNLLKSSKDDTQILNKMHEKMLKRQVPEDTNFYRKVSKYDLDRLDVNWNDYKLER